MRYNKGITINSMFPTREKGRCAYCQGPLTGRQRRWCGWECEKTAVTEFLVVKGDVSTIRKELYKRDEGKCAGCGAENCEWEGRSYHGGRERWRRLRPVRVSNTVSAVPPEEDERGCSRCPP
jgi:hypothetical protein